MIRHLVRGALVLLALAISAPVQAEIITENFEDVGYVAGNALSAFEWDQSPGQPTPAVSTAGVLDIEDVGGAHGKVVKLTLNQPAGGAAFPNLPAKTINWGGPQRADHKLWFSFDVEKGTAQGDTSLSNNIWSLQFAKSNDQELLLLQGGLGTFRVRSIGATTTTPANQAAPTSTFSLIEGWNTVAVYSNLTGGTDPNTIVYLNGAPVASFLVNLGTGQFGNETAANVPQRLVLTRLGRGGDENWVGSMRFDNIRTGNEFYGVPEPSTFVLAGLGLASLLLVRRRRSRT